MKLAEALLLRGDLQKKLASLRERIAANSVVQQKEKPNENPEQLLKEASGIMDELEALVFKINKANLKEKLADGRTLTEALSRRDTLKQRHAIVQAAIEGASKPADRYGLREIKWVATVNVVKLQKQSDDLARTMRELNGMIQETNWRVELQ